MEIKQYRKQKLNEFWNWVDNTTEEMDTLGKQNIKSKKFLVQKNHKCSCLKGLQGQKWRRAWGKGGQVTGSNWKPTQEEAPRPDTITEAMECTQKGAYHDCHLKDPKSSWKSQMQIFTSNRSCWPLWLNYGKAGRSRRGRGPCKRTSSLI